MGNERDSIISPTLSRSSPTNTFNNNNNNSINDINDLLNDIDDELTASDNIPRNIQVIQQIINNEDGNNDDCTDIDEEISATKKCKKLEEKLHKLEEKLNSIASIDVMSKRSKDSFLSIEEDVTMPETIRSSRTGTGKLSALTSTSANKFHDHDHNNNNEEVIHHLLNDNDYI